MSVNLICFKAMVQELYAALAGELLSNIFNASVDGVHFSVAHSLFRSLKLSCGVS